MINFFDNLPEDIINKINIIHLDNVINKIIEKKTNANADMMRYVIETIIKHPAKHLTHDNIRGAQTGQLYYDPFNADIYSIMSMVRHLIKDHNFNLTRHDRFSLIAFLVRPVELGIIELQNNHVTSPFFAKTSLLCEDMVKTLGCHSLRTLVA